MTGRDQPAASSESGVFGTADGRALNAAGSSAPSDSGVSAAAQPQRGVGNGPVAGRFVLFEPQDEGEFYVTSWDTWDEAAAAFPIPPDLVLRDDETGREWLPGAAYEWEAART